MTFKTDAHSKSIQKHVDLPQNLFSSSMIFPFLPILTLQCVIKQTKIKRNDKKEFVKKSSMIFKCLIWLSGRNNDKSQHFNAFFFSHVFQT